MITEAAFWQLPPAVREEQIPSLDPHCLVCGQSLENQPFVWDLFMGPQLDVAGMHLHCAYAMSRQVLRDLAATWHLDPGQLRHFLDAYDQDRQSRAPRPPDIPAS